MDLRKIVARNASGNMLRGISGAVLALGLPPFLTRAMPVAEFSAWALILQLAAYVNYLDVGIQIALARHIAHTHERQEFQLRNEIVTSGVAILTISASVALLIAGILTWQLPHIYPAIPSALLPQVQMGLFFVAGALALALPGSTYTGVLVGLNRSDSSGVLVGVTRLLAGISIVVLARFHAPLSVLAAVLGGFYLLNAGLQILAAYRHCPGLKVFPKLISRLRIKALAADCGYISAWNLGGFLVFGLDLALVGRFDFRNLGAYSVASTLVLFIAGVNGAIFSAMLAPIATLQAQGQIKKIGRLVLKSTRAGIYITVLTSLPLLFAGRMILAHWVTSAYASTAWPILLVLIIANIIRLAGNPYSVAILGTGQQKIVFISPIVEGSVNFIFSIVLGMRLGAMGVALGTLLGAVAGLVWIIVYNVPRTREIPMTRRDYAWRGIVLAFFYTLPGILGLWILYLYGVTISNVFIAATAVAVTLILCLPGVRQTHTIR